MGGCNILGRTQGLYAEMKFEKPSRIQAVTLPMVLAPPYCSLIAQVCTSFPVILGSQTRTLDVRSYFTVFHSELGLRPKHKVGGLILEDVTPITSVILVDVVAPLGYRRRRWSVQQHLWAADMALKGGDGSFRDTPPPPRSIAGALFGERRCVGF
jgi:hypothetical protein